MTTGLFFLFVTVGTACCQFSFILSTNLTLGARGWPGYSRPESEASGARGGRCSLLPAGQVRALECTVQLRRRGPQCWELAEEKVDRWLYSAVRQIFNVYRKGNFRGRKKHSKVNFTFYFTLTNLSLFLEEKNFEQRISWSCELCGLSLTGRFSF